MSDLERLDEALAMVENTKDYSTNLEIILAEAARAYRDLLVNGERVEPEAWYWVTPVDNPDALGDYGGFTFQTYNEAAQFIRAEYAEHARLVQKGYYEPDEAPSLLQIETVQTVKIDIIEADARRTEEEGA